jgi:hypothetical protein
MAADMLFVLKTVAHTLDELGVPYLIGGSMASSIYGNPRTTQDVVLSPTWARNTYQPWSRLGRRSFTLMTWPCAGPCWRSAPST